MKPEKECVIGYECGYTCIDADYKCNQTSENPETINKLVKAILSIGGFLIGQSPLSQPTNKEVIAKSLAKAEDAMSIFLIGLETMNTIPPDEAMEMLHEKHIVDSDGKLISMLEYSEKLEKDPSQSTPRVDPITGYTIDPKYYPPRVKLRKVDDAEVEAVWETLSGTKEGGIILEKIFASTKGSPERPENRIHFDWGDSPEDTLRVRKSQLKAMLEQVAQDSKGNPYVHDPWEPDGRIKTFADLDHIVPLAKGGRHGVAGLAVNNDSGRVAEGLHSENFLWTGRQLNQKYKQDRDIVETVEKIKKDATEVSPKEYQEYIDNGRDWGGLATEDRANEKWDSYNAQVEAQVAKKQKDVLAYSIEERVNSKTPPHPEEIISLLNDESSVGGKRNILKRVVSGLEKASVLTKSEKDTIRKQIEAKDIKEGLQSTIDNLSTYYKLTINAHKTIASKV